MTKSKRIVCYAINGSGLGHLTRLTAVARWLRRYVALLDQRPPEVLFLTSSDASDALSQAGFAAFKIPSKTVAKKAELNKLEYRRLAKHFVWNTLGVFSPDLLVVDTFPSGSFDELFQVLDGPFKKGFIFRDVKPDYAARPTFRSAMGMYDSVIVPHRRPSPQSSSHVSSNGKSSLSRASNGLSNGVSNGKGSQAVPIEATRYCGEVIQFEQEELLPVDVARRELGVADGDRLVYVSAGGGGDPNAAADLKRIVESLQSEPQVHLLVGAGPLYRGSRLAKPRLTWFDATSVWRYFAAVDAAVSAGGYNTFHELLFAKVPTAFFPQSKIADDQEKRIREAFESGACRMIDDVHDADQIVQHVRDLLTREVATSVREACDQLLSENGARNCAIELLRPLYESDKLDWAQSLLSPRIAHALEGIGDGGSENLSNWLTPLMPSGQFEKTGSSDIATLLPRLSSEAAQEVKAVLADELASRDNNAFEECLVGLLDTIEVVARSQTDPNYSRLLGDEVLKTLVAAMKKQPQEASQHEGDRSRWLVQVVDGVNSLLSLSDLPHSECDVLRLYRMFPKVVDVDVVEAFDLFVKFLQQRHASGEPMHEVIHQLQVLKMTHQKVTREVLTTLLEGIPR